MLKSIHTDFEKEAPEADAAAVAEDAGVIPLAEADEAEAAAALVLLTEALLATEDAELADALDAEADALDTDALLDTVLKKLAALPVGLAVERVERAMVEDAAPRVT